MTTSDHISGIVRRVVEEIWNRGDLDLADRLFASGYINHGGLIPDLIRGPEAIKIAVVTFRLAFPGLRIVIDDLVVEGQAVELRWAAHALPTVVGTVETGREPVERLRGVTFVRFVAGQAAESWTFWDTEGGGAQLGLSAPFPSADHAAA